MPPAQKSISTPPVFPPPPGQPFTELRGVWISDPRGLDWRQVMMELHHSGFNTVFVNFSSGGAAFYPSRILPNVASRDEMRACLEAAHSQGLRVHAKFIVWYMFQSPLARQKLMARQNRLLHSGNGTVIIQGDAPWLDPAAKINREERLAAIREALQKYDVDGVQLDYIRFPENAGTITSSRLHSNTDFVLAVRNETKNIRPGIPLSICNFYDYSRARKDMGQDWLLWAQRGYVDFLCPMNYTRDVGALEKWIQTQQHLLNGRVPLYCGLGAYMFSNPQQLNQQIALVRRSRASGFVVFAYNEQFRRQLLAGLRF
jgi:uncharacterized lipoprotein YddW (UPF0748 family)